MDGPSIFTIGYGKRTLDEFLGTLGDHGIQYLVDVRSAPYSSFKPEFSREALEPAIRRRGVRYVYMGDTLGGRPSDESCYVGGKVDYDALKETASFKAGIARLRTAWDKALRVCVMCSEGRPEQCHRSKVIGEVLTGSGLPVAHIDATGELISQRDAINRLNRGQTRLFGEKMTSRKRYRVDTP